MRNLAESQHATLFYFLINTFKCLLGFSFLKQVNRSKLTLKKLSSLVIVKYSRELFKFTSQKELLIEQFIIDTLDAYKQFCLPAVLHKT